MISNTWRAVGHHRSMLAVTRPLIRQRRKLLGTRHISGLPLQTPWATCNKWRVVALRDNFCHEFSLGFSRRRAKASLPLGRDPPSKLRQHGQARVAFKGKTLLVLYCWHVREGLAPDMRGLLAGQRACRRRSLPNATRAPWSFWTLRCGETFAPGVEHLNVPLKSCVR